MMIPLPSSRISELFKAALSRSDMTERPPCVILVDELQTLAMQEFPELISQARKFNVGLVMANQYLEQLDPPQRTGVMTVVNRIAFQVSSKNARQLVDEDYFKAIRKPGPPVRKQKIEPVYNERREIYWDPPTSEQELPHVEAEIKRIRESLKRGEPVDERLVWLTSLGITHERLNPAFNAPDAIPIAAIYRAINRCGTSPRYLKRVSRGHWLFDRWVEEERRFPVHHVMYQLSPGLHEIDTVIMPKAHGSIEFEIWLEDHPQPPPHCLQRASADGDPWKRWFLDELKRRATDEHSAVRCIFKTYNGGIAICCDDSGKTILRHVGHKMRFAGIIVDDGTATHDHHWYNMGTFMDSSEEAAERFFRRGSFQTVQFPETMAFVNHQQRLLEEERERAVAPILDSLARLEAREAELLRHKKTRVVRTPTGYEVVVKQYNPYSDRDEPVYEWVPGDLQSPSQAKAELAQTLAHLPERQSVMRLRLDDGSIWQGMVAPLPADDERDIDQTRRILRRSAAAYTRARTKVEVEIGRRTQVVPSVAKSDEAPRPGKPRTLPIR